MYLFEFGVIFHAYVIVINLKTLKILRFLRIDFELINILIMAANHLFYHACLF